MNQVRKKFVLYAMIALAVLLTVLLGIINGTNFTMVTQDADQVTEMLSSEQNVPIGGQSGAYPENSPASPPDSFSGDASDRGGQMPDFWGGSGRDGFGMPGEGSDDRSENTEQPPFFGGFGGKESDGKDATPPERPDGKDATLPERPDGESGNQSGAAGGDRQPRSFGDMPGWGNMGPSSPETLPSARYFTVRFNQEGTGEIVNFNVSALTEEEALALAKDLKTEKTGWVKTVYRYRVYREAGYTYVIVLDQSRELLPSFRTLLISLIGWGVGLLICFGFLAAVSRRLFRPLEDADRREKNFLKEAEKAFCVPLTVIGTDVEIIDRENGPSSETQSIRRQVEKMTALTRRLGSLSLTENAASDSFDLADLVIARLDRAEDAFREKGVTLTRVIGGAVPFRGDEKALENAIAELADNALKFAVSRVSFTLKTEGDHVVLTVENDTTLPDGPADAAFDRFTRLENAGDTPGSGLGLSFVKEAVLAHNGRLSARVANGVFSIRIVF